MLVDKLHDSRGIGVTGMYTRRLARGHNMKDKRFSYAPEVQYAARQWIRHALIYKRGGARKHCTEMLRIQHTLPQSLLLELNKQVQAA